MWFKVYELNLGLPNWQYGDSGQAGLQYTPTVSAGGIKLELTRPSSVTDTASYGIFVPLALSGVREIKLVATCRSPSGPHAPHDLTDKAKIESVWAVGLSARTGGVSEDTAKANPDPKLGERVSATLQHNLNVVWDPSPARLGSPPEPQNAPPNPLITWLTPSQYHDVYANQKEFELVLFIDPSKQTYFCELLLGGSVVAQTDQPRTLPERLVSGVDTSVGIAVAVAKIEPGVPSATVSVVVSQFRIYHWFPGRPACMDHDRLNEGVAEPAVPRRQE
jgi:hypothetical protein